MHNRNAILHNWDELRFFLAVARSGSVSAAAQALAVNQSTVSRRINAFEQDINVRLFDRLNTGYVLTREGEELLDHAQRIEEEFLSIDRHIMGKNVALSGAIRLTTSMVMLRFALMPVLKKFLQAHPGIELQLDMSNNLYNLSQREADIALRISRDVVPDNLIARQIGEVKLEVYGSSHYIKAYHKAKNPVLKWIGEDVPDKRPQWLAPDIGPIQLVMRCNDVLATLEAVRLGMGVGRLPCFVAEATPGLQVLANTPPLATVPVWLLTHPDMRRVSRIRSFSQFMLAQFSEKNIF